MPFAIWIVRLHPRVDRMAQKVCDRNTPGIATGILKCQEYSPARLRSSGSISRHVFAIQQHEHRLVTSYAGIAHQDVGKSALAGTIWPHQGRESHLV